MIAAKSDVTLLLKSICVGDSKAASELLPLVYDELRQVAARYLGRERTDHTLKATSRAWPPSLSGKHKVVELRFFGGLKVKEASAVLSVFERTVAEDQAVCQAMAFSPDGTLLVGAGGGSKADDVGELLVLGGRFRGQDGFLQVWNLNTHNRTFEISFDPIADLCFGPDGQLAMASWNNTKELEGRVKFWSVTPGGSQVQEDFTIATGSDLVHEIAFSPNGRRLAVATQGGSLEQAVKVWDLETRREDVYTISGSSSRFSDVCFSPDGKQIAAGSFDRTVRIADANSGKQLLNLGGHTEQVLAVAFDPDPTMGRLVSGGMNTIRTWNTQA